MDPEIESLTRRVSRLFRTLITSPSTHLPIALLETRLQDLEGLSDRFRTWRTNIVCQPYGETDPGCRMEDAPELLDTVKEVLQNIGDDLTEGRLHTSKTARIQLICDSPVIPASRSGQHGHCACGDHRAFRW
jgi:hypothetical protein